MKRGKEQWFNGAFHDGERCRNGGKGMIPWRRRWFQSWVDRWLESDGGRRK